MAKVKPTPAALKVIDSIARYGLNATATPKAIAADTGQTVSGVGAVVSAMVRHDWVYRRRGGGMVTYGLTDAGKVLARGRVRPAGEK